MKLPHQLRLNALAADGTAPTQLTSTWEGNRLGTRALVQPEPLHSPMEVTCQLRLDQLTQSGQAQIQVTCCWDGQFTKFGSGQKCLPKHWDAKRERVKDKPDSYAEAINQVLDDYVAAAQATYRAVQGQPLPKEQLRAGIEQHRAALVAERTGRTLLPVLAARVHGLLDYFDDRIKEEEQKISVRTGRKLSADTIWTHRAVRKELADFATRRGQPLSFEGLNKAFYDGLRNYMLGMASRSPRTFNTYVKRLRSFLFWAESQLLPVPPHFRRVPRLAPSYVGKDALTRRAAARSSHRLRLACGADLF